MPTIDQVAAASLDLSASDEILIMQLLGNGQRATGKASIGAFIELAIALGLLPNFSILPPVVTPTDGDYLILVQDGVLKKLTLSQLAAFLGTSEGRPPLVDSLGNVLRDNAGNLLFGS